MKKIVVMFFSLSFFLITHQVYASSEESTIITSVGNEVTQEEFDQLLEMGFSELAIDQMPTDIIQDNLEFTPSEIVSTETYQEVVEFDLSRNLLKADLFLNGENSLIESYVIELSEEEYYKRLNSKEMEALSSSDETSTSYRRLRTTVSKGTDGKYRVNSRFVWDIIPKTRSHDLLSMSIDSEFTPVPGSNFGQQLWGAHIPVYNVLEGGSATYNSSSARWSKQGAGYGVKMNLKNSDKGYIIVDLEGYAYFDIERRSSIVPNYVNVYGNYSHANANVSSSYSYGLSFGGPSISWSGVSGTTFSNITTHARMTYKK